MTPLQQLIYNYIIENQLICDLCISNGFGCNYNQYANTVYHQLHNLVHINRINGHCERCDRNVIINSTVNEN